MGTLSCPRAMSLQTEQTVVMGCQSFQSQENLTCRFWQKKKEGSKLQRFAIWGGLKWQIIQPVQNFLLCLTEPDVLGVPLLPVGLQGCPGLWVVAAAVWRSFSLAVLKKHICSSREEQPEETPSTTSQFWIFIDVFLQSVPIFPLIEPVTHVTQSKRFSRAAMCRGESPWMLTACRSQRVFSSSWAISTLPENAAQWRQMFSS